jgi:DNA invertase Pin-like site-specific DNA recombinase
MKYATGYVRVSSRSQDAAMQEHAIRAMAKARGDKIVTWYREKASAKTLDRVELSRLRQAAHRGSVRRLYVYRLDRLSRSGIRETVSLVDELRRAGVELVSVADGFDLNGPAGDVVMCVMAWAAKIEREVIGGRISAARARMAAKGGAWGRPRRMTASLTLQARELAKKGRTIRSIAQAIGVPRSTVASALARRPT